MGNTWGVSLSETEIPQSSAETVEEIQQQEIVVPEIKT